METIHVPGPPKQAFNKNRRISDLIRAQVNHLKHVEASLPAEQRSGIPQHAITTEADAASYIAAMTNLFKAKAAAPAAPVAPPIPATPVPIKPATPISTAPVALDIAASASPATTKAKSKKAAPPAKEKKRKS